MLHELSCLLLPRYHWPSVQPGGANKKDIGIAIHNPPGVAGHPNAFWKFFTTGNWTNRPRDGGAARRSDSLVHIDSDGQLQAAKQEPVLRFNFSEWTSMKPVALEPYGSNGPTPRPSLFSPAQQPPADVAADRDEASGMLLPDAILCSGIEYVQHECGCANVVFYFVIAQVQVNATPY